MNTMTREIFAIRKSFLIPLGILLAQSLALFGIGLAHGEPRGKLIILGLIILPVAVVFIESLFRRVIIEPERIVVRKFFRRKALEFAATSGVETVRVRKRPGSDPALPGPRGGAQRGDPRHGRGSAGQDHRHRFLLAGRRPFGIDSVYPTRRPAARLIVASAIVDSVDLTMEFI